MEGQGTEALRLNPLRPDAAVFAGAQPSPARRSRGTHTDVRVSRLPLAAAAICGRTEGLLSFLVRTSVSSVSCQRSRPALGDTADHSGPRPQGLKRPSAVWTGLRIKRLISVQLISVDQQDANKAVCD